MTRRHAEIDKLYGIHPVVATDVANQAARLALTTLPNTASGTLTGSALAVGHIVQQNDAPPTFWMLRALPASSASNWSELIANPADKAYVDSVAQGLDPKGNARTASLTTITLSGLQTVSGVALNVNDRVLVLGQTDGTKNGLYTAQSGAWLRTIDADTSAKMTSGAYVVVTEGTKAGFGYLLITADPIVLGTTSLTFSEFGWVGLASTKADKALTLTAGTGLTGGGDLSANRTFATVIQQVFGRATTNIVATLNDYAASLIQNDAVSATGATVKAALDNLFANFQSVASSLITSVVYTANTVAVGTDAGKNIGFNSATDVTYTINSGVFSVGQVLEGAQLGAGRVQFVAGTGGVTITPATGMRLYTRTVLSPFTLYQRSTNVWELYGDLLV